MVISGLGDRPGAGMGGRTPLEAADTPYLDELAQRGETGLLEPGLGQPELPLLTGPSHDDVTRGLQELAAGTLAALNDSGQVHVQIEGPDAAARAGDCEGKRRAIELIDRFYFGPLIKHLSPAAFIVAVTGDRTLPCAGRAPVEDPVPLLISGATLEPEGALTFGESECARGQLGRIRGADLLPMLFKLAT